MKTTDKNIIFVPPLTNKNIVFAPPGRHHAGVKGLYLIVSPDGQVRRFTYRFTSPETRRVTEAKAGIWPMVSLDDAQAKAIELRKQVAHGICPNAAKRAHRVAVTTFRECCEAYIETHKPGWRGTSHLNSVRFLLFGHGKPLLGVPVNQITPDMVQSALSDQWTRHQNQARRALSIFARVLDYAHAKGMRTGDNPAAWRGCQEYRFPRCKKTEQKHYPALAYSKIPEFIKSLVAKQGHSVGAVALELVILTTARPGEVFAMRWDEIDLENRIWTLPANRTKQGRVHQVPLSNRAMAILQARPRLGPYVFVGYKRETHLSSKAMYHVLRAMGIKASDASVHGFRSSFSDWCADCTDFPRELREHSLAHAVGNGTELAYRRGTALKKRGVIMEAWAEYCHQENSLPKAEVPRNLGDDN
jgi:integrase